MPGRPKAAFGATHRAHLGDVPLPTLGTVQELNGKRDDPELFYSFTSFLYPTTVFRYDLMWEFVSAIVEPRARVLAGARGVGEAPAADVDVGITSVADLHVLLALVREGGVAQHDVVDLG